MGVVLFYCFTALASTSAIYFVLAAVCAVLACRSLAASPAANRPRASVLIPLAGREPQLAQNLEAALRALQDGDELVLGAAEPKDAALEVAIDLQKRHPDRVAVVAGSPSRATNRKVAALEVMSERARKPAIVLVDSDVRLDRDLLERLVAPLALARSDGKTVGLATALYRGVPQGGLAARIEALAINCDFAPSVLVARALAGGLDFALGAANALRREALDAIGGFASLGGVLADDNELGRRIAAKGFAIELAPAVVPIGLQSTMRDTFARLLRWCRTYRVCRPAGYAATVVSHHGIFFALAAAIVAAMIGSPTIGAGIAVTMIALRIVTAAIAHVAIAGRDADLASLAILPLRDLLATALFALAWLGRSVTWRGRRFRVERDGTLTPLGAPSAPEPQGRPLAEALADAAAFQNTQNTNSPAVSAGSTGGFAS